MAERLYLMVMAGARSRDRSFKSAVCHWIGRAPDEPTAERLALRHAAAEHPDYAWSTYAEDISADALAYVEHLLPHERKANREKSQ